MQPQRQTDRRSFVEIILVWWRALIQVPPDEGPGTCKLCHESTRAIPVAAQGDAFDFQVHLATTWTSNGLTREELVQSIERNVITATAEVRRRAVRLARRYPPHHVQEFEAALNADLSRQVWPFREVDGLEVSCVPQVRIRADDRIRESVQAVWRRRAEMESEHDLDLRRTELVRERIEIWTEIIEKLQHNPISEHAATLAEGAFASVFRNMLAERDKTTMNLVEVLREAARSHEKIGAYELSAAFDRAIRAYEMRSGLTVSSEGA